MNIAVEAQKPKTDKFKVFLRGLYIVSFIIYFFYLFEGLNYYQIPLIERPHHEDYRNLRPAGMRGQGFGVLGSAMMLFMLLYSLRKRTRIFGEWGSLSRWLDIHIYFGIMGPLFIILHTSFKVSGLVAVSFWSMIAVASSGIVGRYLYLQIPRNQRGDELSLQEIADTDKHFSKELFETLGLDRERLKRMDALVRQFAGQQKGLFAMFSRSMIDDIFRYFKIRKLQKVFVQELSLEEPYLRRAVLTAWRKIKLQRRVMMLNQVQRFFHYWHVFHKPFAIIMYLIMFVHIGVAVWLGYTWIFQAFFE